MIKISAFDLDLGKPNLVSRPVDYSLKRKNVNGDCLAKYKHPYPQVMNFKDTFGALASKIRFESMGKDDFSKLIFFKLGPQYPLYGFWYDKTEPKMVLNLEEFFLFLGEKEYIDRPVSDGPSHVLEPDQGNFDENFDPIQDEMELGMVETLNKIIGKGDLRAKLKSKESKNGKVEPEMDHFDDFQEKGGYETTQPPDVLPN